MIQSIQSLRGIFVLMIFLHHLSLFPAGGDCGVSFFFVLSGFVMCAGYGTRVAGVRFIPFMKRRLVKVWPVHLLCLVAALLLYGSDAGSGIAIACDTLLIQSWVPLRSFYFSGNQVSWFLADMMFFYAVFPALVRLMNCRGRMVRSAGAVLAAYFIVIQFVPDGFTDALIYISPLFRVVDFMLGIVLWRVWMRIREGITARLAGKAVMSAAVQFIALSFVAVTIWVWNFVPSRYGLASMWWPSVMLLLVVMTATDSSRSFVTRLLHSRILLWLGRLSFAFYMVHLLVIDAWSEAMASLAIECPGKYMLAGTMGISILLAWLLTDCVERPLSRRMS